MLPKLFPVKKIILILILLLFIISPSLTLAQDESSQTNGIRSIDPKKWDAGKQGVMAGNTWLGWIICATFDVPTTSDACPVDSWQFKGPDTPPVHETKLSYSSTAGGAIGATSRFMAQMYTNPPASGVQYVAEKVRGGFNIGNPAYAQVVGSGQQVIRPVEKLWVLFRNIAFFFFTVIFMVVGFMIMFRQKLNPQTVISIQNSLPKIVFALILVNFSYFLTGLMIDVAFFGSQFIGVLLLSQSTHSTSVAANDINQILKNSNIISFFWGYILNPELWDRSYTVANTVTNALQSATGGALLAAIAGFATCFSPLGLATIGAAGAVGGGFGLAAAGVGCFAFGGGAALAAGTHIVSLFIIVVLIIGLLQAMLRVTFSLIMAYVQIIIMTIFAPILILFSAIPGQSDSLGTWWRNILANSLIFPAVFGLMILVNVILSLGAQYPATFSQTLPLFGGVPSGFIQVILAYGLLLASPAIPGFVKELLKAKAPPVFGQAVGSNLNRGFQAAGLLGTFGSVALYKGSAGFAQGYLRHREGFWKELANRLERSGSRSKGKEQIAP